MVDILIFLPVARRTEADSSDLSRFAGTLFCASL